MIAVSVPCDVNHPEAYITYPNGSYDNEISSTRVYPSPDNHQAYFQVKIKSKSNNTPKYINVTSKGITTTVYFRNVSSSESPKVSPSDPGPGFDNPPDYKSTSMKMWKDMMKRIKEWGTN